MRTSSPYCLARLRQRCQVVFSADGELVVTASTDGGRVWDWRPIPNVVALLRGTASLSSAEFSPDGKFVVTASQEGAARIWDLYAPEGNAEPIG